MTPAERRHFDGSTRDTTGLPSGSPRVEPKGCPSLGRGTSPMVARTVERNRTRSRVAPRSRRTADSVSDRHGPTPGVPTLETVRKEAVEGRRISSRRTVEAVEKLDQLSSLGCR